MYEVLKAHIARRVELTAAEFKGATAFFIPKKIRRHQFLLQGGEVCRHIAFVEKGCLRAYSIDEAGEEHIVQFALEDWWISDLYSFMSTQPSMLNIDAYEDSELLLLDKPSMDRLCSSVPKFERFFRLLLQSNYVASHRRIIQSISATAEERYLEFLKSHPDIASRVPQSQIASYLGVTPQSLSRIRRTLSRKR
jgi:CRP-like cAMP-binding protein